MFYERMLAENNRLDSQIKELQSKLKEFPAGKIFCTKNRQYYKWYTTDGKTQTYLPKSERQLAEKLTAKKYLSLLLEDLLHEKRAIGFYLRHHNSNGSQAEQMLLNCPEYKELGLADDPDYCKNITSKLNLYTSHGIIPTIQLITTYETKDTPLSVELVEKIINYYFL